MELDEVKAFVRCAELGALSVVARAEGWPKSTLSRLLNRLERGLGVRLLERSPHGALLTDEGRAFLPHARQILSDVELALASAQTRKRGAVGLVRVTAPYSFGVNVLSPLLAGFLRRHPGVDVHLELTSRNLDLVDEGFDLGIRIGPPPESLIARRLMSNPLALCATPAYLSAAGTPTTPEALLRHPLLLIGSSRARASLALCAGDRQRVVSAKARMMSNDPAAILQATLGGAGIGQLPLLIAEHLLTAGALVSVLPDWTLPTVDINLIFARGRTQAPRLRVLVDHLLEHLGTPQR